MRKFSGLLILFPLLVLVGGFFWCQVSLSAPSGQPSAQNKTFVIKKGETLSSVVERLTKEDLIRQPLAFKIYVIAKGLSEKIQTGSFQLNSTLNSKEMVAILIRGPQDLWLTFPEGWRKEEFAARLTANLINFNGQEFLNLVKDAEGKLFPDTYLIPVDASPSVIVEMINKNYLKKTQDLNLNQQDLILASIIEREVKNDTDRPVVAGILKKRLQQGWPLQADATLQYAAANSKLKIQNSKLENWWVPLTKDDLKINSPYNTYKYKDLPPTPICNPGLASIKAVLNPTFTPFWFYLSDKQFQIHYARTNEEHIRNIAQYLNN